ncbi:hypothetical protein PR202_ga26396 [Eleusine coracana subsp. coracana]|uniref:Uncharacterized protein n=1 Tax=Eleusine coracana subsp. coracana TaxID=191504 RepID=A0AAV5DBU0_ELECO|nr:hypothetical protein PR202_ga26396 [Eleusine coracana subsp. coracana]
MSSPLNATTGLLLPQRPNLATARCDRWSPTSAPESRRHLTLPPAHSTPAPCAAAAPVVCHGPPHAPLPLLSYATVRLCVAALPLCPVFASVLCESGRGKGDASEWLWLLWS